MTQYLADYYESPVEIDHGDGCYLYGPDGKKYLDFLAGWCVGNIGWGNKTVRQAIKKEAKRGVYVAPLQTFQPWDEFAKILVENAPGSRLRRVFRCTSGSEAVDFAIKLARAATGRKKIVSVGGVYHGHTYGAASIGTGCSVPMGPCVPDTVHVHMPNEYRGGSTAETLRELEALFSQGDVAAFISEPVWTNAGSIVPPQDFYPAVQELCRKHHVLLVMDEVASGFGRCSRLFASSLWNLEPDILCLGKGLTGGYATMGATLVSEAVYKTGGRIPYYSTFGWLPQDLAATRANVQVILKNKLWLNSGNIGAHLMRLLKPLEELPFVGQVRGIGLQIGIEIVTDKKSKTADQKRSQKIQDACAEAGLIIETAHNVLFITPPLILTRAQAEEGAGILKNVMDKIAK